MLTKVPSPLKYQRSHADSWVDAINSLSINVREGSYGAAGDDTGNDAPAIQAAINDVPLEGGTVYLPAGTYRVTSSIVFPTDRGVRLMGAGRLLTHLHVTANTTASPGIIHIPSFDTGSSVEHLEIIFDQPDTINRLAMTHYVPAIYAVNAPRFRVEHVRISRCWIGIDMRGNAPGDIFDLEISHFETGIWIDGALDTTRFTHLHAWPFACTANQLSAADSDPLNTTVRAGRVDGLHFTACLFRCGTGIRTALGELAIGGPTVHITGCQFDTTCGLIYNGGLVHVTNSTFTVLSASYFAVYASVPPLNAYINAAIQMSNCYFLSDGAGPVPLVQFIGASGGNFLDVSMTGCQFTTGVGDLKTIVIDATPGGSIHCTLDNNQFDRRPNIAYTEPTLFLGANVRATIVNNQTFDKGTGAGDFIQNIGAVLVVDGNILPGWGLDYTSGTVRGQNNIAAGLSGLMQEVSTVMGFAQASGISLINDALTPPFALCRLTGTLDGAGAANVPHGLGSLFQTALVIQAWYKGGASAMGPLNIIAVDATNIAISGGTAGTPYRVTVLYSSNPHSW